MEKPSSPVKSAASKLYPLQFGFHDESTIDTDGEDTLRRKWGQRLWTWEGNRSRMFSEKMTHRRRCSSSKGCT